MNEQAKDLLMDLLNSIISSFEDVERKDELWGKLYMLKELI